MISKIKLLDKYLNLLLIFLFPTQLAIHFWPKFAFIFGIRVDYLSPTIYLTDLLFVFLFINWSTNNYRLIKNDWKKSWKYICIVLAFGLVNIVFSSNIPIVLLRWLKIIELGLLAYYVKSRTDVFSVKTVTSTLFYSLIFFSIIGILQVVRGETSGKIFYLLGERSFTVNTPGMALFYFFGRNYLRAYSTFSHPNSLAGYYCMSLLFLLPVYFNRKKIEIYTGMLIILTALLTTFSLSALVGIIVCGLLIVTGKKVNWPKKGVWVLFICIIASFCFAVLSDNILINKIYISQSIFERIELAKIAGGVSSQNLIVGVGLNNFIPSAMENINRTNALWLLQPVHNIFLLVFSETGIVGLIFLCVILLNLFRNKILKINLWWFSIIIFVLITGLFDHYWFTLQQNMLLTASIFGIFFREKRVSF